MVRITSGPIPTADTSSRVVPTVNIQSVHIPVPGDHKTVTRSLASKSLLCFSSLFDPSEEEEEEMEMLIGGCSSAVSDAATSFKQAIASSSAATSFKRDIAPQFGGFRFHARRCADFASQSRRYLSRLVCLPTNPVRALASSESQVELDPTIEVHGHPQLPHQDDSRMVRVRIQLMRECQFGEQFFVVGAQPELGLWNPLDAVPMTWSDGHVWTIELDIAIGELVQFKLILREVSGEFLWQPGQDRVLQTWETSNVISVFEDWENVESQQVTEERKVNDKYGESDALKTKRLEYSDEMYNDDEISGSAHSVADDITLHTNPDMDRVRGDEKISDVQDEAAISDTGLINSEDIVGFKEVPILVPGLDPCSTEATEDVTAKEDLVEFEPDISSIRSGIKPEEPEEQVNGHSGQEAATGRLSVNGKHPPVTAEHSNELASNGDEDVNDSPDQDLEYSFSEGQSNKESASLHDDVSWGSKTLKSFLSNLGFL